MSLVYRLCFFASLLTTHSIAFADTLGDRAEARQLADRVMEKVAAGKIDEGVRLTRPYYANVTDTQFQLILEGFEEKRKGLSMSETFGKTLGTEFIREEKVGEHLFRLTYMQRCDKFPMRWEFYFYHGKDGWTMYWMSWDDDIVGMFPR